VRDVSLLAGYEYSCGIMDGESVLVEASIAGSLYELWAGNPASCADNSSKRIATLLRLADAQHISLSSNKPLVPTRNGEAPLLAAQRRRSAAVRPSRDV
jgi:hypothetical protein